MTTSVTWLVITAAIDTGTKRMNWVPVLLRSQSRSGRGSMRKADLAILGASTVMFVLEWAAA